MSRYLWAGLQGPVGICINENVYDLTLNHHVHAKAVFDFSLASDKLRERCLTALRLGYTTSEQVKDVLLPLSQHFRFPMGFVGKTQAYVALPDAPMERLNEILKTVEAALSMRGMRRYSRMHFATANGVRENGFIVVDIQLQAHSDDPDAPIAREKTDRLLPRLEFMKGIAKDLAAETFPERAKTYNLFYHKQTLEIELSVVPKPRPERKKRRRSR